MSEKAIAKAEEIVKSKTAAGYGGGLITLLEKNGNPVIDKVDSQ